MNDTDINYDGSQAVDTGRLRETLAAIEAITANGSTFGDGLVLQGLVRDVRVLLARPIPNVTRKGGKIVRAVIDGKPRVPGYYKSWWVACEDDTEWVTWECYVMDDVDDAPRLAYNAGEYFYSPDQVVNKRRALRDLARRAGITDAS
jgi:hypothetical protein